MIDIYPFIRVDLKTHMQIWSGKLIECSNLKVFKVLVVVNIKQDKLDVKVVKRDFNCYLEGMKCYKWWKAKPRGSIFFISMYVTLGETRMRMKSKHLEVKDFRNYSGKYLVYPTITLLQKDDTVHHQKSLLTSSCFETKIIYIYLSI